MKIRNDKGLRSTFSEYCNTTPLEYGTFYGAFRKGNVTNSVTFAKQTQILQILLRLNAHTMHPLCSTHCSTAPLFNEVLHTIQTILCSTTKQTTQHVPERKVFYKTNTTIF